MAVASGNIGDGLEPYRRWRSGARNLALQNTARNCRAFVATLSPQNVILTWRPKTRALGIVVTPFGRITYWTFGINENHGVSWAR